MNKMSNKQEILAGLSVVVLALQLTSIVTPHWSVKDLSNDPEFVKLQLKDGKADVSLGLWKGCGEILGKAASKTSVSGDVCVHLPVDGWKTFPKNSLTAVRSFAIIGAVLVLAGLYCMLYMKSKQQCGGMLLAVGGVCSLIATTIWGIELRKFKSDDGTIEVKMDLGYSFYLNMVAGILAVLGGAYHYYM
jgi:hypothetical protein